MPPEPVRIRKVAHVALRHGQLNVATPTNSTVPLVVRPYGRVRLDPRALVRCVGHVLGLDVQLLASRRRTPELIAGRRVVAHAGAMLGLANADIASVLGISAPSISQMLRWTPQPTSLCEQVCRLLASESRTANNLTPKLF